MRYSHRWSVQRDFTVAEWNLLCRYTRAHLRREEIQVTGSLGIGDPIIDPHALALNGCGDQGHEVFVLLRCVEDYGQGKAEANSSCETARKPYDAIVIRILAAAQQISPNNLIASSDGGDDVFSKLGVLIT